MNKNNNNSSETEVVQSPKSSLLQKLQHFYMALPLNFSTLTGWRYPGIPRLMGNPITGRLGYFLGDDGILKNLIAAGQLASRHSSGICYFWIANKLVLLVTKPEHIKEVLITNDRNISRRSATRFIESFWGPNIATDQGDIWKKKRAIYLEHLAERQALTSYEPAMLATAEKYLQEVSEKGNKPLEFQELASRFTLDMVLNLMTPHEIPRDIQSLVDYTTFVGNNVANIRNIFKWSLPAFIRKIIFRNEPVDQAEVKKQMQTDFNKILLAPNENYIKNNPNFIRSIWELRKDQPGQSNLLTNADVFGDGNALFFTAQDTVTSTLEFTIKLLCAHPVVEEKLRNELKSHLVDKEFSLSHLDEIPYLDMIIKEVLRLYPASPMLPARGVDHPFKIDNLPLKKGDLIIVSPYLTQRLPNFWQDPEKFDPERFSKTNASSIPLHAYLPFGDGRHACVGWRFAFEQIKIFLGTFYLRYHLEVENNNFEIAFKKTTLRPKNNTIVRFIPVGP